MPYLPQYDITHELIRLIAEATELKTWIHQSTIGVSWLPALQRETALRLTHSSTSIEGNPLSMDEVKTVLLGEEIVASEKAKREVLNQFNALKWVFNQKKPRIEEVDLLKLHRSIMKDLLPSVKIGKYKTTSNRIVDAHGRTVYTPPPPKVARPMTLDLLRWLNSNQNIHPIIASAIAHFRLVSIHPFSDGNGRTSRALALWILHIRGFDTDHVCALDEYFLEGHQKYYDKLTQARDMDENLTYWIEYVAQGIVHSLRKTKERMLSLSLSHSKNRHGMTPEEKLILTKKQEEVLRLLRDHKRMRTPELQKLLHITRARISQIMQPLVKSGLVLMEGQTRSTTYRLST